MCGNHWTKAQLSVALVVKMAWAEADEKDLTDLF